MQLYEIKEDKKLWMKTLSLINLQDTFMKLKKRRRLEIKPKRQTQFCESRDETLVETPTWKGWTSVLWNYKREDTSDETKTLHSHNTQFHESKNSEKVLSIYKPTAEKALERLHPPLGIWTKEHLSNVSIYSPSLFLNENIKLI